MTRRLADTDNEDRDVVRPTAQIGQIDEKTACLGGRQHAGDGADLGVGNLPAQAVAAQEVDVPRLDGMRAFQIHLHQRLGTERADDNVAGIEWAGNMKNRRQTALGAGVARSIIELGHPVCAGEFCASDKIGIDKSIHRGAIVKS